VESTKELSLFSGRGRWFRFRAFRKCSTTDIMSEKGRKTRTQNFGYIKCFKSSFTDVSHNSCIEQRHNFLGTTHSTSHSSSSSSSSSSPSSFAKIMALFSRSSASKLSICESRSAFIRSAGPGSLPILSAI